MQEQRIRVLLVDDDPVVLDTVERLFQDVEDFEVVGKAHGKEEAIEFLKHHVADAVFLDIQMPGENGFALAAYLKKELPQICYVFLTGHAGFALEGYDYTPVDFLVKPVDTQKFNRALGRIREKREGGRIKEKRPRIGIYTDIGFSMIDVQEVLYLEKENRRVVIWNQDGSEVSTAMSMQELENIFSEYGFFRCHQSYLVQTEAVAGIMPDLFGRSYHLLLRGSAQKIPLSRRKYLELKELLKGRTE